MKLRRSSSQMRAVVLLVALCIPLLLAVPARAQETTATPDATATIEPTSNPTVAPTSVGESQVGSPEAATMTPTPTVTTSKPITKNDLRFSLIAFGAALLAILLLLAFMRWSFDRSLRALLSLARRGSNVTPTYVVATMQATEDGNAALARDEGQKLSLEITGPITLPVGAESKFSVTPSDTKVTFPTLEWSKVETVSPDPVLTLSVTNSGREATITPNSPGSFKLRVRATGAEENNWNEATRDLIAVEPKDGNGTRIPFFGSGYGSQVLALFLMAVIVILGMSERISSDAIAGVIGAIAGYIFGTTVGAKRED